MNIGDRVEKIGGDYQFEGIIVAKFSKLSGLVRFVVEDNRGVLHIYSEKNLRLIGQVRPCEAKEAVLKRLEGGEVECMVPDNAVYPQHVSLDGRVFIYGGMRGPKRVFFEVSALNAQRVKS